MLVIYEEGICRNRIIIMNRVVYRRQAEGRYTISARVDMTSGAPLEIYSWVQDVLRREHEWEMRWSTFEGFQRGSAIQLVLTGMNVHNSIEIEVKKTFPVRLLEEVESLMSDIRNWAGGFVGDNVDYSVNIHRIMLRFIPPHAGGCGKHSTISKVHGNIIETKSAEHNNCFFKCVGDLLSVPCGSRKQCNDVRRQFNIAEDAPITKEQAYRIFSAYNETGEYSLHIVEHDETYETEALERVVRLRRGHYTRIIGNVQSHRCPRCRTLYTRKHTCQQCVQCRAWYANVHTCQAKCRCCGQRHSTDRECWSVDCASYYQQQVLKNPQRFVQDPLKKEHQLNIRNILHYDIETYPDPEDHHHVPYIVGFSYRGIEYEEIAGVNCMESFVERVIELASEHPKDTLILNAFNGANFDHYFVLSVLLKKKLKLKKFLMNNGSIIGGSYKNIRVYDVRKHVQGSLRANLKALKCAVQKGDFDHNLGQPWETMPEDARIECSKYLRGDVLGLRELTEKLAHATFNEYAVDLTQFISTSQLTYSLWAKHINERGQRFVVTVPNFEQEDFFRPSIFGGRCYKTKGFFYSKQRNAYLDGEIEFEEIDDYLIDMDVVSLYPAAMRNYAYPTRLPQKCSLELCAQLTQGQPMNLPMGIFRVKYYPNTQLAHAILPQRTHSGLQWTLHEGEGTYNSVDLENALRCGYRIEFQEGYTWEHSAKIFETYIDELFVKKQNAEKGSASYLLYKLFMNSLYGKTIQRPIADDDCFVSKNAEFWAFYNKHHIKEMEFMGEDMMYLSGPPRDEREQFLKISKPCHVGSFVLGYSRRIMLQYMMESNPYFNSPNANLQIAHDFYYTDTDSLHVHARDQCVLDKNLGGIDNDLKDAKIVCAYYIAPKLYMLEMVHANSREVKLYFRGKGVETERLNEQVFTLMRSGQAVAMQRSFQMKKINVSRNSKQQHLENFSVLHKYEEETTRVLNTSPWNGRYFLDENTSTPFGSLEHSKRIRIQ